MRHLPLRLLSLAPVLLAPGVLGSSLLAQAQTTSAVVMTAKASGNCPVGFVAQRLPGGQLVSAAAEKGNARSPISFSVTFLERTQGIAAARISLHGLESAEWMPAARLAPTSNLASATESFSLDLKPESNHRYRATVYTQKLTGVLSVELTELTFRDGSEWRGSAADPCRVTPDGFLLVTAAK